MNDVSFISLNKIRLKLIVPLYNRIYSDYYFETRYNKVSFKHYLKKLPADLEISQAIKVKNDLVGLAIVSLENKNAWISSLGIIKSFRRQGLGDVLLKRVIAKTKEAGVCQIGLEALDYNFPANKLYKKHGFEIISKLTSLEGKLNKSNSSNLELVKLTFSRVDNYIKDCSTDVWSRRKQFLKSSNIEWVGLKSKDDLLALIGYEADESMVIKRIKTLKSNMEISVLRSFFNLLASKDEFDKKFYLLNFSDDEKQVITVAKQFGLEEFLVQNLLMLRIKND